MVKVNGDIIWSLDIREEAEQEALPITIYQETATRKTDAHHEVSNSGFDTQFSQRKNMLKLNATNIQISTESARNQASNVSKQKPATFKDQPQKDQITLSFVKVCSKKVPRTDSKQSQDCSIILSANRYTMP